LKQEQFVKFINLSMTGFGPDYGKQRRNFPQF
jgi:hypothetical protein